MKPTVLGNNQRYIRVIFLAVVIVLLSFWLAPAPTPAPASSELTSKVLNSTIILDSYFISHSGSAYGLNVLIRRDADFIPVQIRLADSRTTHRTLSLTATPDQHCPFADARSQAAGIVSALKAGEWIAYDSRSISNYPYATALVKSVDLIVEVQGKLFEVDAVQVSGECFWAQE